VDTAEGRETSVTVKGDAAAIIKVTRYWQ